MPTDVHTAGRPRPTRRDHRRRARAVSVMVLIVGLVISGVVFAVRKSTVDHAGQATFERQSDAITAAVSSSLRPSVEIIDELAGWYRRRGDISIEDFRAFERSLSLPTRYTGTYTVVFVMPTSDTQMPSIVQRARDQGIPATEPQQRFDSYDLVVHAAPEQTRGNATGIDTRSLPAIGRVLDRARDSGEVTLSDSIPFSTLEGTQPTAGEPRMFALVKPVYTTEKSPATVDARRSELRGWAAVAVYGDVFLERARGSGKNRIGVELWSGASSAASGFLAAQPSNEQGPPERGQLNRTVTVKQYGQSWTLRYKALVSFSESSARREPFLVLATGIAISILLFALVFVLMRSNARALDMVDDATKELREAEQRFRGAFEFAPIGMAIIAPDGCLTRVNRALCVMLGRDEDELLGLTIDDVTHPEFQDADLGDHQRLLDGAIESYETEKCYLHADGSVVWGALSLSRVANTADETMYLIGKLEDVTERKDAEAKLEYRATHDPLTGLPNRVLFLDRLEHALARSERDGTALAVLYLDLDGFKSVNDSLGHAAGDRLLRDLANRFRPVLRPADTISRFGGDEFTILCEQVEGTAEAVAVAERLADVAAQPVDLGGIEVRVTASIGVALEGPGASPEGLLHAADRALYVAKQRGRDRVERFDAAAPEYRALVDDRR